MPPAIGASRFILPFAFVHTFQKYVKTFQSLGQTLKIIRVFNRHQQEQDKWPQIAQIQLSETLDFLVLIS